MAGESTADRILAAADRLFGERGFDAVSMRDVAQEARANKALVFYHFGSKEKLFERVLDRYYTLHRAALREALHADLPVRERIHRLVDGYLDFIAEHRNYARLVQRQVAGSGPDSAFIRDNLVRMLEWTRGALEEVAPADGPMSAGHLFITMVGAVVNTFTYGPVLAPAWGMDPVSEAGLEERRAHLHLLVDALLGKLLDDGVGEGGGGPDRAGGVDGAAPDR